MLVNSANDVLNRLDLRFLEERLATLLADPGGNRVEAQMNALPIEMKRRGGSFHLSVTVYARHEVFVRTAWGRNRMRFAARSLRCFRKSASAKLWAGYQRTR